MAANLSGVVVFLLCVFSLTPIVSAGDDCESYTDSKGLYNFRDTCFGRQFCCGTCENRYCCSNSWNRLTEDAQDSCIIYSHNSSSTLTITSAVASIVILIILIISCCVCPCCCLYKMCRKPTPVIATTTTQVISTTYPQQPASGAQAYQGAQYPGYHPVPVQPGYGGQPTAPATYQGQPYQAGPQPGPPPPYQLAAGPGYPPGPGMSYSQAAFTPGQLAYSLQPPDQPGYPPQPQPGYPPQPQPSYPSQPQPGYPSQSEPQAPTQPAYNPAYNPAYAEPPPKTGY